MKLEGATVLITGGAKRVGRGIAMALARQNAQVAISYQTSSKAAEATVKEIQALGTKALAVPADISKPQDVDRLIKTVHKTLGSLDILITHSPPFGIHDEDSQAHQGLKALNFLIRVTRPRYHFHGHTHFYRNNLEDAVTKIEGTTVMNIFPYKVIEINEGEP